MTVRTGLDRLRTSVPPFLRGRRVGLIAHQASVTGDLVHAVDVLRNRRDLRLTALFAPEHGFAGEQQDQVEIGVQKDLRTGLPIHSLYGPHRSPGPETLRSLDALVLDLQDVGVRYYTFIWTLALVLRAAAAARKSVVVLDRPNPLGGLRVDGNWPEEDHASFVGLHPLPVEHGLTIGEVARYLNATQGWGTDLHVVPMTGWTRAQRFGDTGLPWVLPSPNMPTVDTATVYGGGCLLEATNVSEGRGTTRPFEIVGAPYIDGNRLAEALGRHKLPGVLFRPLVFRPTFNKWAGQICGGVQWHVTDPSVFRSYWTGLVFLQTVRNLWPRQFRWLPPPYEYETVKPPMDILCGTDIPRRRIDRGEDLRPWARSWRGPLTLFRRDRKPFLMYPDTGRK